MSGGIWEAGSKVVQAVVGTVWVGCGGDADGGLGGGIVGTSDILNKIALCSNQYYNRKFNKEEHNQKFNRGKHPSEFQQ